MKYQLNLSLLLVTAILSFNRAIIYSQTLENANEFCTDPHIRTILLHCVGWDLSMPVIHPDENEKLILDFDYLDTLADSYSYSITNCTYDWKWSDLSEREYIEGFNDVSINEVSHSVNTTRSFTHFSTSFPNDELKINQSGNYLLKVYKNGEPEKIVFTKRFCIAEHLADISAIVKMPDKENQEINLTIGLGNLELQNPLNEIKVVIIRNYDWNSKVNITSSPLLQDNKLIFDLPYQISSPGENEFRYFDIKNLKYYSERVSSVRFLNPDFHVFLKPDELLQFKQYFSLKDINGRCYIDVSDAHNRYNEADYVYVHFILSAPQPIQSDVFLYGALTSYRIDKTTAMNYNYEKAEYEKTLLLKQGYYDYAYATLNVTGKKIDFEITEGIHSETENEYAVFVYLKRTMSDLDRLVGFKIVNSTNAVK
jgi:hypothetical protein